MSSGPTQGMPLNGGALDGQWSTPSHSRWEWNDADWEDQLASGDPGAVAILGRVALVVVGAQRSFE